MAYDSTPRGDEMVRRLPERKIPDTKPQAGHEDAEMGESPHGSAGGSEKSSRGDTRAVDISSRPSLPSAPRQMAADIEDEDDDPVIDSGPGIAR